MIIDYRADYAHAQQHEILDAITWQPLPMDEVYSNIWYADDQKGILRILMTAENGRILLAHESNPQVPLSDGQLWVKRNGKIEEREPICAAWREEKRPIRIVKKEATA